jgi:hypothetical protein
VRVGDKKYAEVGCNIVVNLYKKKLSPLDKRYNSERKYYWFTGIVIYGKEYFGIYEDDIFDDPGESMKYGCPVKTIKCGYTEVSEFEFLR